MKIFVPTREQLGRLARNINDQELNAVGGASCKCSACNSCTCSCSTCRCSANCSWSCWKGTPIEHLDLRQRSDL